MSNRRILVIGSTGHSRQVTSVSWYEAIPNVADFDVVLVDLTPLSEEHKLYQTYRDHVPSTESFINLLESGGQAYVITVPPVERIFEDRLLLSNYSWCPLIPRLKRESGETVEVEEIAFEAYFSALKQWSFYFTSIDHTFLQEWYRAARRSQPDLVNVEVSVDWEPLAVNRYKKPLGVSVTYSVTVVCGHDLGVSQHEISPDGSIHFLHPPSQISSKEGLDIILRDLYGIGIREPEPEWAARLRVPEQDTIEKEIKEAEDIIGAERAKIDAASTELAGRRKFIELLYQKGERLQELVWEALENISATVTRPTVDNKEDGWVSTPFGEGVLETKSSKGSASFDDVRQLDGWVLNGREKGKEYKGILIGNYFCEKPLTSRRKPFPANVIKEAKKREQCLLTTRQLFEAHCAVQEGTDGKAFLEKMMKTAGPCTLVEKPKWSV